MTRVRLALASAVSVVLIGACTVLVVRTSAAPKTLAVIAGGRVAQAATTAEGAAPMTPAAAALAVLGPRASALTSPTKLDAALVAAGYKLPPGAAVYAAKITKEGGALAYDDFEGGAGALGTDFWPASSIKVLAAVGALEFVGQQGFTGAATVRFGNGAPQTIRSIYDLAIRISDNASYDALVQIAGIDFLNQQLLTPARGFPKTVIQRSYTVGGNLRSSPAMTLAEGGRKVVVPARNGTVDTDCPQGQCSNLFEMSESVRRLVLHNEIPESDRFKLAPADVAGLTSAMLAAEGWFEPAVAKVIGSGARIYGKPGEVSGRDCLDVTLIDTGKGQRLLLSATVPEGQGGCPSLVNLATAALKVLTK